MIPIYLEEGSFIFLIPPLISSPHRLGHRHWGVMICVENTLSILLCNRVLSSLDIEVYKLICWYLQLSVSQVWGRLVTKWPPGLMEYSQYG